LKTEQIRIRTISSKETHDVRHPVLRAGRPIEDCIFEGDDDNSTIHLGLFLNQKLVGVATFLKNNHAHFKELVQYQLRGMAILKKQQKKGFGDLLLKESELILSDKKANRLWFNAREIATNFYKKNGYEIVGNLFEIPDIGLHCLMTKKIN